MFDKLYGSERIRGFSDGMFGVIITIMVLDLKAPESSDPHDLLRLWPTFLAYVLSFMQAAIYWVNHHALFKDAEKVDDRVLWLNLLMLFALSLMPFATAYMGNNNASSFPTAVYAFVMLLPALVFDSLHRAIAHVNPGEAKATGKAMLKGWIAMALYVAAIPMAFVSPAVALLLVFTVAVMYFLPTTYF